MLIHTWTAWRYLPYYGHLSASALAESWDDDDDDCQEIKHGWTLTLFWFEMNWSVSRFAWSRILWNGVFNQTVKILLRLVARMSHFENLSDATSIKRYLPTLSFRLPDLCDLLRQNQWADNDKENISRESELKQLFSFADGERNLQIVAHSEGFAVVSLQLGSKLDRLGQEFRSPAKRWH